LRRRWGSLWFIPASQQAKQKIMTVLVFKLIRQYGPTLFYPSF
jgi:hypothetical protein